MERHDYLPVSEGANGKERIAWRNSSRFKLLVFSVILALYGVTFSGLFIANSVRYAARNQRLTDRRTAYYDGYSGIANVSLSLNRLLGSSYTGAETEADFAQSCEALRDFITESLSDPALVYEYDLGIICGKFLESAAKAASYRTAQASQDDMLLAYSECTDIYSVIQSFSPYATSEMENAVNQGLADARLKMTRTIRWIIAFLIIATCLIIRLIVWFSGYFLHPVEELAGLIRSTDLTAWEITDPPTERADEMGMLYRVFYRMMNQIRRQYDELFEKQEVERQLIREQEKNIRSQALLAKTQLKVFQSQINSHFLFNTLNMIGSLANIEDAPRTQSAAELLAAFLRSVLNQFSKTITLAEEFETVDQYVRIQQLRFGDRMVFESFLDEELSGVKVPSMTLQPLVENAIIHGVAGLEHGFIRYSAEETEGGALISVFNDGTGMTAQEALALEHKITSSTGQASQEILSDDESRHGIGLINVYRRLNLLYPGRVKFLVESEEGEYTKISLEIRYEQ